jgi:hypothetical protein
MCAVRITTASGDLMFHSIIGNVRTSLAIIGILASVGMFSIATEASPTNQSVSHIQLAGSDDDLGTSTSTTNGVFGWD